jgi:hypothetical protein
MTDILREAPLGKLIRFLSRNTILPYPEELTGFKYLAISDAALSLPKLRQGAITTTTATNKRTQLPNRTSCERTIASPGSLVSEQNIVQQRLRDHDLEDLHLSRPKSRLELRPTLKSDWKSKRNLLLNGRRQHQSFHGSPRMVAFSWTGIPTIMKQILRSCPTESAFWCR